MTDLHDRLRTILFLVPFAYRNRGVLLSELAARLSIDEGELFRELEFLLVVGRPPFSPDDLIEIHVDSGRVFVDLPSSLREPPRFTVFEALALACAAELWSEPGQAGIAAAPVRAALDRVLASLPDETRALFDDLAERYLVAGGSSTPFLAVLREGIDLRREVDMSYFSAGRAEISVRTVRPHGLAQRAGTWYLVAYCTDRKDMRVFRLSRIQSARLTDRTFDAAENFDTGAFLDDRFTIPCSGEREVVVSFAPEDARFVQERWRGKYSAPQPDGRLEVRLFDVSDEFVLAYVASFAGRAQIVSPERLRRALEEQAHRALQQYA